MYKYILLMFFVFLSSIVIILFSCGKPVEHSLYSANFTGTVIDADTLSPIEGAVVRCRSLDNIGDTTTVTDTAGIFWFYRIPIHTTWGTVELTVTKFGYIEFKKQYKINSLETVKIPDIYLFPESKKK
ncbi:MAG: carboxypeptidase regulatory-like domain-containing protein [Ignavibacteria bacterium]|nr:carboxypeptidase regulatory-like domain-containing protein [Ignavibacteria bacterium]